MLPHFRRLEGNKQVGSLVDEKFHGVGGPWTTEQFHHAPELAHDVLQAADELGFGVSDDLNGDNFTGFAIAQVNHR